MVAAAALAAMPFMSDPDEAAVAEVFNHGGTEMGQGLNTKVAQVVAQEFGLTADRVRITATTTAKVPNTSATAASSGSDMNGMAAKAAAATIRGRLADFAAKNWKVAKSRIRFEKGNVIVGNQSIGFGDLAKKAHQARISLSSTGFYATPKVAWDRAKAKGRPFYYFAYGAACAEVTIDTLTGEMRVDRVDILHDVGRSINPAIDIGQIEGGFVQGMGWLTTEELVFDDKGRLATMRRRPIRFPAPPMCRRNSAWRSTTRKAIARIPSTAPRRWASRR